MLAADHVIARFKTKWWPNKRMGRSGYEKAKKDNGLTMTSIYKAKEGNTSTKQLHNRRINTNSSSGDM